MAVFGFDAYSPAEIARRVNEVGVAKVHLPLAATAMLGVLAGAFIALGSLYYTLVASDASLGFAATRVLGGVVFSVGLVLVLVAGGELFTGNNLLAMAWAEGTVSTRELLRNWCIALCANAVGAFGIALLVVGTGYPLMNGGAVGVTAVKIAVAKSTMPLSQAFLQGSCATCSYAWPCGSHWPGAP